MSILFALVAAIGWGSSDFAAGHASRKSSAVSVVILTHFAAFVALLAITLIPGQGGSPGGSDIGWGLAAGLGGGFGAMLLFRGLGKGSMAVVAPITATGAATIPVVAGLMQGESISLFGVGGVALALIAIVMVSLAADDGDAETETETELADLLTSSAAMIEQPVELAFAPPAGPGPVSLEMPAVGAMQWPAPASASVLMAPPVALLNHTAPAPMATSAGAWPAPPAPVVSTFAPPTLAQAGVPATVVAQRAAASDILSQPASGGVALLERPPAVAPPSPGQPLPGSLDLGSIPAHRPPPVEPDGPSDSVHDAGEPAGRPSSGLASVLNRPGVVDALMSGVGFGLFFVFIARTSESAGHWPLVVARLLSAAMFFFGALLARGAVLPERGSRRAVVLAGLLDAAAAVFFVLSTRAGLLSVGAVLASLYPAVTIVLARFITKERITRNQVAGLVLAGLAITLLAI